MPCWSRQIEVQEGELAQQFWGAGGRRRRTMFTYGHGHVSFSQVWHEIPPGHGTLLPNSGWDEWTDQSHLKYTEMSYTWNVHGWAIHEMYMDELYLKCTWIGNYTWNVHRWAILEIYIDELYLQCSWMSYTRNVHRWVALLCELCKMNSYRNTRWFHSQGGVSSQGKKS